MENTNLRIWNVLGKTDPAHTKQFTRAGGFRGTAIKPMWANMKMTETFGPCGHGWGMSEPHFETQWAGDELMVFCTVGLWYKECDNIESDYVYGVGGDKVLIKGKDGLRSSDEAFKAAYTDALSNAMKMIGVAADVHMGLFDDSKYVQSMKEEFAAEVTKEVETQKANPAAVPPEIDWAYNKASGVLICRILDAKKTKKKDGKGEVVTLKLNNTLDAGKSKTMIYYFHKTHQDLLLASVGKVVKLIIEQKGDFFNVADVIEVAGEKVSSDAVMNAATEQIQSKLGTKPFEHPETQARLLASTLELTEGELKQLVNNYSGGDWTIALSKLQAEKLRRSTMAEMEPA